MQIRRQWSVLAAAAAMVLVLASGWAVFAQQVTGSGTLHAQGNGSANINLAGGSMTISGSGTFSYADNAGDGHLTLHGTGHKQAVDSNAWAYSGFSGSATISGSSVYVTMSGSNLTVDVAGYSGAEFNGSWTCYANGTACDS